MEDNDIVYKTLTKSGDNKKDSNVRLVDQTAEVKAEADDALGLPRSSNEQDNSTKTDRASVHDAKPETFDQAETGKLKADSSSDKDNTDRSEVVQENKPCLYKVGILCTRENVPEQSALSKDIDCKSVANEDSPSTSTVEKSISKSDTDNDNRSLPH